MKQHVLCLVLCAIAFAVVPMASASTLEVCPSGCLYQNIQNAIATASSGDTIAIGTGTYIENIVVDKSLTLKRATPSDQPLIIPAASKPNPCSGPSLCGSANAASNIILVAANDVTIDGLTLDGDNPNLTSGIVAGGADLDARNGIIVDYYSGVYDNLTVSHVTVRNIYLRGIYASSGGTFNFHDNVVQNVQADPASIAMFNFGGSGVMADNRVSDASDAISSNWSRGVQFLGNTIIDSASGVHTDNAGGDGGTADTIEGNRVSRCTTDGYGIWVFAPYVAPTISDNEITSCAVGLAMFGKGYDVVGPVTPSFTDNTLNGASAATNGSSDSLGVLVSTDILGYGSRDVSALFTGNVITHFGTGIYVEQQCELLSSYFPDDCSSPTHASAQFRVGVVLGNRVGADGRDNTNVEAEDNWWGCSNGPSSPGCDTVVGTVDALPFLAKPPHR